MFTELYNFYFIISYSLPIYRISWEEVHKLREIVNKVILNKESYINMYLICIEYLWVFKV